MVVFQAHMVSFQCSPLATADGILATFRQCAHIQRDKDKRKFVAVAVLDEIGLAEDSPRMPLKVWLIGYKLFFSALCFQWNILFVCVGKTSS